jgi:hypothetical protein
MSRTEAPARPVPVAPAGTTIVGAPVTDKTCIRGDCPVREYQRSLSPRSLTGLLSSLSVEASVASCLSDLLERNVTHVAIVASLDGHGENG